MGVSENDGQEDTPIQIPLLEPATQPALETINIIATNVTIEQPDSSEPNKSCPDSEKDEENLYFTETYVEGYIWIGRGIGKEQNKDCWQEPTQFLQKLKRAFQRKSDTLEKHREILKKHVMKGKAFFISKDTGRFIESNKEVVGEEVYSIYLKYKPDSR